MNKVTKKLTLTAHIVSILLIVAFSAQAQTYTIDENNAVLSGDAFLQNGSILFNNGGASATLNLPAGNYIVTANRDTYDNGNMAFILSANGNQLTLDYSFPPSGGSNDVYQIATYLGYVHSSGSPVTITMGPGGQWLARLSYVQLNATSDIYFDENTSDLTFVNSAAAYLNTPNGFTNTLQNSSGNNGIDIATDGSGVGSVAGTILLTAGQTYGVYVSRQVNANSSSQLSFDVSLNGSFFSTIDGLARNVPDDAVEEIYAGLFTAPASSVSVLVNDPGAYGGRLDYIRFAAVPEPSTVALLSISLLGLLGFNRHFQRSRKSTGKLADHL